MSIRSPASKRVASVQVVSDNRLPLVVERTMFWDPTYYGGHTANAVAQPEPQLVLRRRLPGLLRHLRADRQCERRPTTATFTFLRENDTPVVKTVPVGAFARKTIYAGDYRESSAAPSASSSTPRGR